MADKTKMCLWLDMETTGDDPYGDTILEVAWGITTWEYEVVMHPQTQLIRQADKMWGEFMIPVVREMHEKSGLTAAINADTDTWELYQVEREIMHNLIEYGPNAEWVLCGSGVSQLDSRFIKAQMSNLQELLTYYFIDIGQVRRYLRDQCGLELDPVAQAVLAEFPKTHRAKDDIEQHFAEAMLYREHIKTLMRIAGQPIEMADNAAGASVTVSPAVYGGGVTVDPACACGEMILPAGVTLETGSIRHNHTKCLPYTKVR